VRAIIHSRPKWTTWPVRDQYRDRVAFVLRGGEVVTYPRGKRHIGLDSIDSTFQEIMWTRKRGGVRYVGGILGSHRVEGLRAFWSGTKPRVLCPLFQASVCLTEGYSWQQRQYSPTRQLQQISATILQDADAGRRRRRWHAEPTAWHSAWRFGPSSPATCSSDSQLTPLNWHQSAPYISQSVVFIRFCHPLRMCGSHALPCFNSAPSLPFHPDPFVNVARCIDYGANKSFPSFLVPGVYLRR
jgi:hypothetical protein